MALRQLMAFVRLQAAVMSYADVFLMMTVLFLGLAAFGVLMRRPAKMAVSEGGH
jgi:MFS transporter, DHA2 family, multidrug resistance protein